MIILEMFVVHLIALIAIMGGNTALAMRRERATTNIGEISLVKYSTSIISRMISRNLNDLRRAHEVKMGMFNAYDDSYHRINTTPSTRIATAILTLDYVNSACPRPLRGNESVGYKFKGVEIDRNDLIYHYNHSYAADFNFVPYTDNDRFISLYVMFRAYQASLLFRICSLLYEPNPDQKSTHKDQQIHENCESLSRYMFWFATLWAEKKTHDAMYIGKASKEDGNTSDISSDFVEKLRQLFIHGKKDEAETSERQTVQNISALMNNMNLEFFMDEEFIKMACPLPTRKYSYKSDRSNNRKFEKPRRSSKDSAERYYDKIKQTIMDHHSEHLPSPEIGRYFESTFVGDGDIINDPVELLPPYEDVKMIFEKHADFKAIEKLDPFRQRTVFRDDKGSTENKLRSNPTEILRYLEHLWAIKKEETLIGQLKEEMDNDHPSHVAEHLPNLQNTIHNFRTANRGFKLKKIDTTASATGRMSASIDYIAAAVR